jgi:hypothetical protein
MEGEFPTMLGRLTRLSHLDFHENRIAVPISLRKLDNLRVWSLWVSSRTNSREACQVRWASWPDWPLWVFWPALFPTILVTCFSWRLPIFSTMTWQRVWKIYYVGQLLEFFLRTVWNLRLSVVVVLSVVIEGGMEHVGIMECHNKKRTDDPCNLGDTCFPLFVLWCRLAWFRSASPAMFKIWHYNTCLLFKMQWTILVFAAAFFSTANDFSIWWVVPASLFNTRFGWFSSLLQSLLFGYPNNCFFLFHTSHKGLSCSIQPLFLFKTVLLCI